MIGRVHPELDPNLIPPCPPTSCPLLLPGLTSENLPLGFRRDSRHGVFTQSGSGHIVRPLHPSSCSTTTDRKLCADALGMRIENTYIHTFLPFYFSLYSM